MNPQTSKLLLYPRHIAAALGDSHMPPPIMVDVDPVDGVCNLDCAWCCQASSRASRPATFMSVDNMQRLAGFCSDWGVRAWRVSGDSEPTLNKWLDVLLRAGVANGISVGLITNGTFLERVIDDLGGLSWLGVSLDAATASVWSRLKRAPEELFDKIINNVRLAREQWPRLDISLKAVRWKSDECLDKSGFGLNVIKADDGDNTDDLVTLPELARSLGVRCIMRDAYPRDMAKSYKFTSCRATIIGGVFCADGRFDLCCDARGKFVLTNDYERDLRQLWGSDLHREMIASIDPSGCPGCAKAGHNEALEQAALAEQVEFI